MSFFSNLFSKDNTPALPDFSLVKTDLHSHLIPSLDDGAKSLEESTELIKGLHELGYQKLVTTPHVMSDYYMNSSESILKGLEIIREAVRLEKINIEIEAAAEYYLDYNFKSKIADNDVLTIGDNYVLFELSYYDPPQILKEVIFDLQTSGYKPILAHPERYIYWHNDFEKYNDLKDREVHFQLNINSLTGEYSPQTKKIAEKLINENLIEFIGTDTHNKHHLQLLGSALKNKVLSRLISSGKLLNGTI